MTGKLAGGAVILAAGASSRFGSDKRRFALADGRTMLETALATYQTAFDEIFLVLKPIDEAWASPLT
ncbi:MAG: NTP transferase domain-containing protein, partial [Gammaproteobacteria bacterium]|nr:NTP transferase domain-containing protein [Gammaproteobacteria bacterium]